MDAGPAQPAHQPASPSPLQTSSPERTNQQRTPAIDVLLTNERICDPSASLLMAVLHEPPPSENLPSPVSPTRDPQEGSKRPAKPLSQAKQDALARRLAHEAALRRALIGREEAESLVLSLRHTITTLDEQLSEHRTREQRVGQRLESVMEELHRCKESSAHSSGAWEKEVRKVRKEAFRSSSAVVKLQEELKASRAEVRTLNKEIQGGKVTMEEWKQTAFEREFEVVGVRAEAEGLKERVGVVEMERDALMVRMEGEELARLAGEGRIALPAEREEDEERMEEFSPVKRIVEARPTQTMAPLISTTREADTMTEVVEVEEKDSESTTDAMAEIMTSLHEELSYERSVVREAEATIAFMQLECQLKICSCRLADERLTSYIYDPLFNPMTARTRMASVWTDQEAVLERPRSKNSERRLCMIRMPSRQQRHQHSPSPSTTRDKTAVESEASLLDLLTESFQHHNPAPPTPRPLVRPTSSHAQQAIRPSTSILRPHIHPTSYAQAPPHHQPDPSRMHPAFHLSHLPVTTSPTSTTTPPRALSRPSYITTHHSTVLIPLAPSTPTSPSITSRSRSSPPVPRSLPPGSLTRSRSRPRNVHLQSSTDNISTTRPYQDTAPDWKQTFPLTPSREQALAQIKERRGRARSVAEGRLGVTPRRPTPAASEQARTTERKREKASDGEMIPMARRDLSAPAGRKWGADTRIKDSRPVR